MKKVFLYLICLLIPVSILAQHQESEAYRPKIHYSPAAGWMSDPNGLVYYDGEYHLCYQHMPEGPFTGMHWGHAVSRDLLYWENLLVAISPDSLGYIYSGCTVFDQYNTSGFGTTENPPLVAFFTYHDPVLERKGDIKAESQAIAYSTDRGRTWTKYAKNPVLSNPGIKDFRDPKVIWDKQTKQWLMALACGDDIKFYNSKDCINWNFLSEFGKGRGSHIGPWECPDFFPLKVQGSSETKFALLVSVVDFTNTPNRLATATQYFIGDFDGKTFTTNQQDTLWIDYGKDCYAGVTFDNAPNNRRIFVAWMNSHQYGGQIRGAITKKWAGAATFPRELAIVKDNGQYRLNIEPVKEIKNLYKKQVKLAKAKVNDTIILSSNLTFDTAPIDINLSFAADKLPEKYGICLKNEEGEYILFGYNRDKQQFYVDRTNATAVKFHDQFASIQTAPYKVDKMDKDMKWRLLVDVSSAELFVGNNKVVFSDVFYPSSLFNSVEVFSKNGTVNMKGGTITELKSILNIKK